MGRVWNKSAVLRFIDQGGEASDKFVEQAMVAIFKRQTDAEKAQADAVNRNDMGFSKGTAPKGTYYARWVNSGRRLSGKHLDIARRIARYHARQLTIIANGGLRVAGDGLDSKSLKRDRLAKQVRQMEANTAWARH